MKEEINKDEILKVIKRQMIAFLILLIATGGVFIYSNCQIIELNNRVRKIEHELDYTKFQKAYFEISNSNKIFSENDLESAIGTKASKYEKAKNEGDYNSYVFEIDDEELKVFLNDNNELRFIQYTKKGELTLVNNLEKNTAVGEYGEGVTSEFKLDSLEEQQRIFDEINN